MQETIGGMHKAIDCLDRNLGFHINTSSFFFPILRDIRDIAHDHDRIRGSGDRSAAGSSDGSTGAESNNLKKERKRERYLAMLFFTSGRMEVSRTINDPGLNMRSPTSV